MISSVKITYKKTDKIKLKVGVPFALVEIICPVKTPKRDIQSFIDTNQSWINSKLEHSIVLNSASNSTALIFGKKYEIKTSDEKAARLEFSTLFLPKRDEVTLQNFTKKLLLEKTEYYINVYEEQLDVDCQHYAVRNMKSKYGVCHVNKKKIIISERMIHFPVECLEYVIVHELAHLKVPNHSKEFYRLVDTVFRKRAYCESILKGRLLWNL